MMYCLSRSTTLFILAAAFSMNSYSTSSYLPPDFNDSNRQEKIQNFLPEITKMYEAYAQKNHIPGYAFGVMVDGKLIYSGSGGFSDIEKKIKASPQTMFRIASMTKSFTAMAILKLRDEGKLKLDDPVSMYVPEIKGQKLTQDGPEITIRNLLSHSAGLPQDDPWGDRHLGMGTPDLKRFVKEGVSFANTPGVAYEYSNLAFALLGMIIDKAAGMTYQEYIHKTIWQPLAMQQASWEFSAIPAAQFALGYKWLDQKWQKEELLHDGSFGAMGGMITSIEAFSHYVALHQNAWPPRNDGETGFIKRSALREMQQPWQFISLDMKYQFLDGEQCTLARGYGYGLTWARDCEDKNYVGHTGGLPGYGSNWLIMPEYGVGVMFFANHTYAPAADINMHILHRMVKDAKLKPRELPVPQILKERQDALVKLLPEWSGAETSGIFAMNFFLDSALEARKKESMQLFKKAGKIRQVDAIIPENQLRGYYIMKGEHANLKVSFTLTPENHALIQEYHIEEVKKIG